MFYFVNVLILDSNTVAVAACHESCFPGNSAPHRGSPQSSSHDAESFTTYYSSKLLLDLSSTTASLEVFKQTDPEEYLDYSLV
jgi:hypothetical protein